MAKFVAHTVVHRDGSPEFFVPGDVVPKWALPLVGDHVIDGRPKQDTKTPDGTGASASDSPAVDGAAKDKALEETTEKSKQDTKTPSLDFSNGAPVKASAKPASKK